MKKRTGTSGGDKRPPAVHMSEEDKADLQQFRELAARMGPKQKQAVIHQMLAKPGTP